MRQRGWLVLILVQFVSLAIVRADDAPAPWKFDVVHLKSGVVLRGLLGEETPRGTRFQDVRRRPGRPIVIFHTVLRPGEVARAERLSDDDRKVLQERIQEIEQNAPEAEKERLGALELQPIVWGGKKDGGWRYASDYFDLSSNAPEEIVRRAALRLEQIYTAYARFLPPRHQGGRPTPVQTITDFKEYSRMLREQKQQFLNPAFYEPAGNRIVCASDLVGLGQKLAAVKQLHHRMRADLDPAQADYPKLYKGKERLALLQPITDKRRELNAADELNNDLFHL